MWARDIDLIRFSLVRACTCSSKDEKDFKTFIHIGRSIIETIRTERIQPVRLTYFGFVVRLSTTFPRQNPGERSIFILTCNTLKIPAAMPIILTNDR